MPSSMNPSPEPGLPTTRASWAPVFVLAFLAFAMSTAEGLPGSMMPLMSEGLNTSEGMIGQATTATAIMAIITSLSVGRIAGTIDRRLILITFTSTLVVSNLVVAISPTVWSMLAARLLLGVTIGMNWGLIPAIVVRIAPQGRTARSLSITLAGASMAGVVSAPMAAFFGDAIGWRVVYFGATTMAALALVGLVLSFPALPFGGSMVRRDVRGTLSLPGMLAGMTGMIFIFGGAQALFGYVVPFLEDVTGLSAGQVSLVLLLTGITGVLGTLAAPKLLARSTWGVLVIATATMSVLATILLIVGHIVIATVIVLMMAILARMHVGVGANAWIAKTFPDHLEGAGGLLVAFIQGSMMLGAMIGGALIDQQGAKAPPAAAAVILAGGAVWAYTMMRPKVVLSMDNEVIAVEPLVMESMPVIVEEIA